MVYYYYVYDSFYWKSKKSSTKKYVAFIGYLILLLGNIIYSFYAA